MTEDKIDQHVQAIAQYIVEEDARRHAATHGHTTMDAIMARISAEVTKQAMQKKTEG